MAHRFPGRRDRGTAPRRGSRLNRPQPPYPRSDLPFTRRLPCLSPGVRSARYPASDRPFATSSRSHLRWCRHAQPPVTGRAPWRGPCRAPRSPHKHARSRCRSSIPPPRNASATAMRFFSIVVKGKEILIPDDHPADDQDDDQQRHATRTPPSARHCICRPQAAAPRARSSRRRGGQPGAVLAPPQIGAARTARNSPAKLKNSTTPIHGWMARVHCPPPNSSVRKNNEGWNSASPDNASNTRHVAVIQWLMRARPV